MAALTCLKGDARGVSISDTGMLMLAPRLTEVFNTEQAFIWSSAVDAREMFTWAPVTMEKFSRVLPMGVALCFMTPQSWM